LLVNGGLAGGHCLGGVSLGWTRLARAYGAAQVTAVIFAVLMGYRCAAKRLDGFAVGDYA